MRPPELTWLERFLLVFAMGQSLLIYIVCKFFYNAGELGRKADESEGKDPE